MTTSFADLGVPHKLVRALARRDLTEPFPIQVLTLTDALAGRDLCGRAPTGSGKTLAFSLPLAMRTPRGASKRPRALVLVPTRELAQQVTDVLRPLAETMDRSVHAVYGGTSVPRDIERMRRGVDILVACPGRLADLVQRGAVKLGDVELVVLDEADRMADMGFLPEVRRLLDATSSQRQTLLYSATLDGDVDVLVRRYQSNPVRHELETVAEEQGDVRHLFWRAEGPQRLDATRAICAAAGSAIVFTRTKRGADRVVKRFRRDGVDAAPLHGNRSQNQRQKALDDFAAGRVSTLVATDVAARGIHVDDVGVVVHFDPPENEKDYVHRSGRTGRAGADGLVVTLVPEHRIGDVKGIQRALDLPGGIGPVALDMLSDGGARIPIRTAAPAPVQASAPGPAPARGKQANGEHAERARQGRRGAREDQSRRDRRAAHNRGRRGRTATSGRSRS